MEDLFTASSTYDWNCSKEVRVRVENPRKDGDMRPSRDLYSEGLQRWFMIGFKRLATHNMANRSGMKEVSTAIIHMT